MTDTARTRTTRKRRIFFFYPIDQKPMSDPPEFFPAEDHPPNHKDYKIKCGAILLTYNDESVAEMTPADMMVALAPQLETVSRYSIGKEMGARTHFHVYVESKKQFDHKLDYWTVNGKMPSDVKTNQIKGSGARRSRDRGHFYCVCTYKNTHLAETNNYRPAHDYEVNLQWISALWAQGKIDYPDVIPCAAFYNCLTPNFSNKVRICQATNLKAEKDEACLQRQKRLKASRCEFKTYAIATEWRAQYDSEADRYKFLVVHGPSRLGKSHLVYSWFKKPFLHKDHVCWLDYPDDCDALIFEDVDDIGSYIERNKSMFQASGVVKVNSSPTDQWAFPVDLTQKPIIITTNNFQGTRWIDSNSYFLDLKEITWVTV